MAPRGGMASARKCDALVKAESDEAHVEGEARVFVASRGAGVGV